MMSKRIFKHPEKTKEKMRKSKLGELNPRWNNDASEYKNHSKLKKARIDVLIKAKGKCEACGNKARVVHHVDESKNNHSPENLIALCNNCHWAIHKIDYVDLENKNTKYTRKYGMTLEQLALRFNVCKATISIWSKKPEKEKIIIDMIKNQEHE